MEDLYTVKQVAQILKVDDTTVRRWIKRGELDAITLPSSGPRRNYRVRKSSLEQLFASPSPFEAAFA